MTYILVCSNRKCPVWDWKGPETARISAEAHIERNGSSHVVTCYKAETEFVVAGIIKPKPRKKKG